MTKSLEKRGLGLLRCVWIPLLGFLWRVRVTGLIRLWGASFGWGDSGGSSYFRSADEDGTGLDGEGASFDVSDHFRAFFNFDAVSADDISVNFSVDDNRLGLDFGLEVGVFSDGEGTFGGDFAFDATIDEEVIGKANGAIDVDVITQDVSLPAGGGGRRLLRGGLLRSSGWWS